MWQGGITALRRMVKGFSADRGLGVDIVYKRVVGMEYDAASQAAAPTYSATALRAIPGQITNIDGESDRISLGKVAREFTIAGEDLADAPRPGDLIECGTATYRVWKIARDGAGIRYRIEALRQ